MTDQLALKLTLWFKKNARTLPWRSKPHPYAVWISEIMLQQTRVATVLPYFERFMKAFPSVDVLARAPIDEVYSLWAGLGYYSRARNLHRGAKMIHEMGRFPKNREEWLQVSGVGEYTAGAVCSIALKQREAIVDGNVVRVLARVYKIKKLDPKKIQIWKKTSDLVQVTRVGRQKIEPDVLNQSLMELGALICKPKNPDCGNCPIKLECRGKKTPLLYPEPKEKKKFSRVEESKWILVKKDKVFLIQNSEKSWRHGLWDFPNSSSLDLGKVKMKWVKEFHVDYVITTHKVKRLHRLFHLSDGVSKKTEREGRWFALDQLPGVPAPVKKAIKIVVGTPQS